MKLVSPGGGVPNTLVQGFDPNIGTYLGWQKATTKIDGTSIVDADATGKMFLKDTTTGEYYRRGIERSISVLMFGADPFGVSDSTQAFRDAANVSNLTGEVWVPNGNYKITGTINLPFDGIRFICDTNAIIKPVGTFNVFTCSSNYCEFMVNIDGTATKPTGGTAAYVASIVLFGTNRCWIHDCRITNFQGGGISLLQRSSTIGCTYNVVENNYIENCVGKDGSGSLQDMSHIRIGYAGDGYFHVGNKILRNTLLGNHNMEIGIGAICHGYDNLFEGNTIKDFDAYGIAAYEASYGDGTVPLLYRCGIAFNHISGIGVLSGTTAKGMGIYMQKCHYSSIVGNCLDNTMLGSNLSGSLSEAAIGLGQSIGTTVTSNVLMRNNRHGIRAVACFNGNISGNTIDTTGGFGIYITDCSDFSVTDNNIYKATATGINGLFRSTLDSDVAANGLMADYAGRPTGTGLVITGNTIEKSQNANPAISLTGTAAGLQGGINRNYNPIDGLIIADNTIRVSTTGINLALTINSNVSRNITRHFATNATGIIIGSTCDNVILTQNDIKPDSSIASMAQGIVYSGTNPIFGQNIIGATSGLRISYNGINILASKFVGYSTAAPGAGTWATGDHIVNTNPSIVGTDPDRQYFIEGWTYIASSWRECRFYPTLRVTDRAVRSVSANTTLTLDDEYVEVDATSGNVTITQPAALSGKRFIIKKIDSTLNTVTVINSGGLTFDQNGTSRSMNIGRGMLHSEFNGTYWSILMLSTPSGALSPRLATYTNANGVQVVDQGCASFSTGNTNRTYQLLAANLWTNKFALVKKTDSGTGTVQTLPASGENIDGANGKTIRGQGGYLLLYSDGTNVMVVSISSIGEQYSGVSTNSTDLLSTSFLDANFPTANFGDEVWFTSLADAPSNIGWAKKNSGYWITKTDYVKTS
ncbi:NosD domain-containing protein [Chitinophaga pinensis]|uniref:Parallel beta-helix repeat protein n=1 Tax=Chitinophaga pinensis (strain ATCC 43595 / DSM 2588 / LMG 13176 / NBRC 15968 / NCIMB 11800 / UQM 2034) TaxID=485918 RepID=A0A979G679_CHIPD|nr:right-handed parallel beta-helix repeat-containing protein [Chitinophaga pinensis]ACU61367.1 parallel beta-helix repeat protein [Chitinophaga pinensis DSM 2588]